MCLAFFKMFKLCFHGMCLEPVLRNELLLPSAVTSADTFGFEATPESGAAVTGRSNIVKQKGVLRESRKHRFSFAMALKAVSTSHLKESSKCFRGHLNSSFFQAVEYACKAEQLWYFRQVTTLEWSKHKVKAETLGGHWPVLKR